MNAAIRRLIAVTVVLALAGAASVSLSATAMAALEETGRLGGDGFSAGGDLDAGPGGTIGAYDPTSGRASIFSPAGALLRTIERPPGFEGKGDRLSLDLRDDGSVELFDRVTQRLHRFDEAGQSSGQLNFAIPGTVREFSPDPRGGYIAAFGDDLMVSRFDGTGQEIVTWPTGRRLDGDPYGGVRIEIDLDHEDDRVMVQSGTLIGAFSRSGEPWTNWSFRDSECRATVEGFRDFGIDGQDQLYALGSHSAPGPKAVLYKFDETLNVIWREELDRAFSTVAVGTDGAIYLGGETGKPVPALFRFVHHDDPQAPRWGKCPEPEPPPPAKPKFKLLRLGYAAGRSSARVRFYASVPGVVRLSGRKIRPQRLRIRKAGRYWIKVRAKPRFLVPARPRRKLRLRAVLSFRHSGGTLRRSAVVQLRGKPRKR